MADTWIIDITHFGTDRASIWDIPPHARRLAEYFGSIIGAATLTGPGLVVHTALRCRRRPGRKPCPGRIVVERLEVPPEIEWSCSSCGDRGVLRNWRRTGWDLSEKGEFLNGTERRIGIELTAEQYDVLRKGGVAFDAESDRIVLGAITTGRGIEIRGTFDELDYFLECLAAEANHETNPARRRLLDAAYDVLQAEMDALP
ncbi:MAG: hypothetical protein JXA49_01985 [Actinobacteria bacterium]|nr:hypothetical protein [Actinomycetota bacterium]